MDALRRVIPGFLLSLPALLLLYFGIVHLRDGMAVDAAIPVPVYMTAQIAMPKAAYVDASDALSFANPRDGTAILERAEAALLGGAPPASQVAALTDGLMRQPASARGWTLLAETSMPSDKPRAAAALSQALILAPRDYWLVAARAHDAALLWDHLDAETQARAMEQARMLWEEPALRGRLREFLRGPDGVKLMARSLPGSSEELREMNRWLSAERRREALEERRAP